MLTVKIGMLYYAAKLIINMLLAIVGLIIGIDALYFNMKFYDKFKDKLNSVIMIIIQLLIAFLIYPFIFIIGFKQLIFIGIDIIADKIMSLFNK